MAESSIKLSLEYSPPKGMDDGGAGCLSNLASEPGEPFEELSYGISQLLSEHEQLIGHEELHIASLEVGHKDLL